jgi:hypothetical protein
VYIRFLAEEQQVLPLPECSVELRRATRMPSAERMITIMRGLLRQILIGELEFKEILFA